MVGPAKEAAQERTLIRSSGFRVLEVVLFHAVVEINPSIAPMIEDVNDSPGEDDEGKDEDHGWRWC